MAVTILRKQKDLFCASMNIKITIFCILLVSCQGKREQNDIVIKRYSNGSVWVEKVFPNLNDTSTYKIKIFGQNGNLFQTAEVIKGNYVNSKHTYYPNGKLYQIDSLNSPQIIGSKIWSGEVRRFYENGNLSQSYQVKNGIMHGLFRNFKETGVISKEYEVIDTIKYGIYIEHYDDGKKSFQTSYVQGKHFGMDYFFNQNGDTTQYMLFNGKDYKFPYKSWLKNGIVLTGRYINPEGTKVEWVWYNKDGIETKNKVVFNKKRFFKVPE